MVNYILMIRKLSVSLDTGGLKKQNNYIIHPFDLEIKSSLN